LSRLLIDNIGLLASGDLAEPRLQADSLLIEDAAIAQIGGRPHVDEHLDAGGGLVCPGFWDAHHYAFFGDYAPLSESRGYLEASVRCGVTSAVSVGAAHLPGRPRDALGGTQLAILSTRSWAVERPLGLKMLAGTLIAAARLTADDLSEAASAGVTCLSFLDEVPGAPELAQLAGAKGFRIVAEAPVAEGVSADVILSVNGTRTHPGLDDTEVGRFLNRSNPMLVLSATGSLKRAVEIATRFPLDRLTLGSAQPDRVGVRPDAIPSMIELLVGFGNLDPCRAIALASGNAARAYAQRGGVIRVGAPADLLLASTTSGSDVVRDLADGQRLRIQHVFIDGAIS